MMHFSITEFCHMVLNPIPDGRGDYRLGHRQFSVFGYRVGEDDDIDYLVIDRIGVGELAARDPDSFQRDVYGRLFDRFDVEAVR